MFTRENMHMSFDFSEEILIINQNSPKSVLYLFWWLKHLVYYNLIVCCSLDPVVVIWYVILVNFLEIQSYLSKLKK